MVKVNAGALDSRWLPGPYRTLKPLLSPSLRSPCQQATTVSSSAESRTPMRLKPSGNTTSASADPRVVACPFLPYPVLLPPAFPKNCSYRNDQSLFHRTWAETKENVSRLTLPCAVAILISIFPRAALSQACPDTARKDSGRLCATLAISQGHWTVQPQGLTLRRGTLPAGITEAQVRDSLQAAVQEAEFPYRLGLDAEGRAK